MRHKFIVRWFPACWVFGVIGPHGGMLCWTLALGPLWVEFWPHAKPLPKYPF